MRDEFTKIPCQISLLMAPFYWCPSSLRITSFRVGLWEPGLVLPGKMGLVRSPSQHLLLTAAACCTKKNYCSSALSHLRAASTCHYVFSPCPLWGGKMRCDFQTSSHSFPTIDFKVPKVRLSRFSCTMRYN